MTTPCTLALLVMCLRRVRLAFIVGVALVAFARRGSAQTGADAVRAYAARQARIVFVLQGSGEELGSLERSATLVAAELERQGHTAIRAHDLPLHARGALEQELAACAERTVFLLAAGRRPHAIRQAETCLAAFSETHNVRPPSQAETLSAFNLCLYWVRSVLESRGSLDSLLARCDAIAPGLEPSEADHPAMVIAALRGARLAGPRLHFVGAQGGVVEVNGVVLRVPPTGLAMVALPVALWTCTGDTVGCAAMLRPTFTSSAGTGTAGENQIETVTTAPLDCRASFCSGAAATATLIAPFSGARVWILRAQQSAIDIETLPEGQHQGLRILTAGEHYPAAEIAPIVVDLLQHATTTQQPQQPVAAPIVASRDTHALIAAGAIGLAVVGFAAAWTTWAIRLENRDEPQFNVRALPLGLGIGSAVFVAIAAPLLLDRVQELPWWSWLMLGVGAVATGIGVHELALDGGCANRDTLGCLRVYRTLDHGILWIAQGVGVMAIPVSQLLGMLMGPSAVQVAALPLQDGAMFNVQGRYQ